MKKGVRAKTNLIDEAATIDVEKVVSTVGKVSCDVNVREEPQFNSKVIKIYRAGELVEFTEEKSGFVKLANEDGWIRKEYID